MKYPCESKPLAQRCDHKGPGGFMGHTCQPVPSTSKPWAGLTYDALKVNMKLLTGDETPKERELVNLIFRMYRRIEVLETALKATEKK